MITESAEEGIVEGLFVHDAYKTGPLGLAGASKTINENYYKVNTNYSITGEMLTNMFSRVIDSLKLIGAGESSNKLLPTTSYKLSASCYYLIGNR